MNMTPPTLPAEPIRIIPASAIQLTCVNCGHSQGDHARSRFDCRACNCAQFVAAPVSEPAATAPRLLPGSWMCCGGINGAGLETCLECGKPRVPSPDATPDAGAETDEIDTLLGDMQWRHLQVGLSTEDVGRLLKIIADQRTELTALRSGTGDAERWRFLRDNGLSHALRARGGLMELHFGYEKSGVTMPTGMVGGDPAELLTRAVDDAIAATRPQPEDRTP